jgi:hypothetical protein
MTLRYISYIYLCYAIFPRVDLHCVLRKEATCSSEMLIAISEGRVQCVIRANKSTHLSLKNRKYFAFNQFNYTLLNDNRNT